MRLRQVPVMAQNFGGVVFDNRGVGKPDKPDEEDAVRLMASDAAHLLFPEKADAINRAIVDFISGRKVE
jgi:hypothetical protein